MQLDRGEKQHHHDCDRHRVPVKKGQQHIAVFADGDRDERIGGGSREPIAPADREAGESSESPTGIHILSARLGDPAALKLGEGERPQQGVQSPDQPDPQVPRRCRGLACRHRRGAQNADPDGVADDDGEPEGHAQYLKEAAPLRPGRIERLGG